jgi:NAD(P) transhydrogenase subunit alpha
MPTIAVGVVRETAAGERRVALAPDGVTRLQAAGVTVLVESGAGQAAWYPDSAYAAAGATLVNHEQVYADTDVLLCVQPPPDIAAGLHAYVG